MALCHVGKGKSGMRLMANELILVPADACAERSAAGITWPFADSLPPEKITEIDQAGLSIVTFHNHPEGAERFSAIDDRNDKQLFASVGNWFDDCRPNGAAIMMPCGKIVSRLVDAKGRFTMIESNAVVGENIRIWKHGGGGKRISQPMGKGVFNSLRRIWKRGRNSKPASDYGLRILQTFGKGTFDLLRNMRVGVVGCSGTGSIVCELLARNCIGSLVIVDPDHMEEKNLNRIVNATMADARKSAPKVEVVKRAIREMEMGTHVDAYHSDTTDTAVVEALTDCDVLFGCVDSAEGRYHLECIASAYFIPYFDVGVNLEAGAEGKIEQADAVAHYMHPENADLMSRGGYTSEQVTAEGWRRTNKKHYEEQRAAGYLAAVGEDQPAVISVNMQAACLAFNDFLARLHHFRLDQNDDFSSQRVRLVHGSYESSREGNASTPLFRKYAGMGEKSFLIQQLKGQ